MKNQIDFDKVVLWVMLIVRTGILVAIVWFGINEYKRWKKKNPNADIISDSDDTDNNDNSTS